MEITERLVRSLNENKLDAYYHVAYSDIYNMFGHVVIEESIGSYQGDTLVFYHTPEWFGYLAFGWGSCSVCDALQACESFSDVADLANLLYSQIVKLDSLEKARDFVHNHDWGGDWHTQYSGAFVRQIRDYLGMGE